MSHSKLPLLSYLATPVLALSLAIAPAGCDSSSDDENHQFITQGDGEEATREDHSIAEGLSLEKVHEMRAIVRAEEAAASVDATRDDIIRQGNLANALARDLPNTMPSFETRIAKTELAELSADQLLGRLGYAPISVHSVEGDKDVYDDGSLRLRVSRTVPGYFKFADRNLLDEAKAIDANQTSVSAKEVESITGAMLNTLGIPAEEVFKIEAHPITLDGGDSSGKTFDYGTVGYVVNVKRQVEERSVLGSECTMKFDTKGQLNWARCRWPQFRVADLKPRASDDVVAGMARQLDRAMPPSASVSDVEIATEYAYAERVTSAGVEYVPSLRTILVAKDGGGAGEFLEAVSGEPI